MYGFYCNYACWDLLTSLVTSVHIFFYINLETFWPYLLSNIYSFLVFLSFWDSDYMNVRPLGIVLQVIEVLFLSQKHFLLFLFRLDTNDLSVLILALSSTIFNKLLRLSSQLFILEVIIFNSKFSFGYFLKFLFLCWDSYLFGDYDISSLKSLYIFIKI